MKMFASLLMVTLIGFQCAEALAETTQDCFKFQGEMKKETLSFLILGKAKPAFVCITADGHSAKDVSVGLYDQQAIKVGTLTAVLQSQARCFNCVDTVYLATHFFNHSIGYGGEVSLQLRLEGDFNLSSRFLENGFITIGESKISIMDY